MAKVACVIPARYGSTRLPGKPLADIAGKPMIQRVYEQVQKAKKIDTVIVATDHELVLKTVENFGGNVMMTDKNHLTGTDRLAEVAQKYEDFDVIINVQGDEPLIEPQVIDDLVSYFEQENHGPMATVAAPLEDKDKDNPAAVKVVCKCNGDALYFSRSLMPYPRNNGVKPLKHIGIYGYERNFLLKYAKMEPTPLELTESLEQLRALENGYTIQVIRTPKAFVGVDTIEDLKAVNAYFIQKEKCDERG